MFHLIHFTSDREVKTCNFNVVSKGTIHPQRCMEIHDMLYITDGNWEIIQDGDSFMLENDDMIFLHAGHSHGGTIGCPRDTKVMYLHMSADALDSASSYCEKTDWMDTLALQTVTNCKNKPRVKQLFKKIIYYYYSDTPGVSMKIKILLMDLLYELAAQKEIGSVETYSDLFQEVIYKIKASPQENFSLSELSKEFYISKNALAEGFKKATGMTLHRYQMDIKLQMAAALLVDEAEMPLREIAGVYGFCDEFYFSKLFKKKYGISPSSYRLENPTMRKRPVTGCICQ